MKLVALLLPFTKIAEELTAIRELYELDLASRDPPIVRVTEEPSKGDTEVTYMGDEDLPRKSKIRHLLDAWNKDAEDHED